MSLEQVYDYMLGFNELLEMIEDENDRVRLNLTVNVFCYNNDIEVIYEDYDTG